VPAYIWEGNAIPGRVNRLLAGWSQRVGATFEASLRALPRSRTTIAGNPIRRSLLRWTRESGRQELGLPADATVVFVTGGSQGSAAINHAVSGALPRLLRRATVIHHTGDAHLAPIAAKRETLPGDLRDRYHVYGFLREEMGAALASAVLVVGRASSSSIAEPLAFGVPLILVPFAASKVVATVAPSAASAAASGHVPLSEPLTWSPRASSRRAIADIPMPPIPTTWNRVTRIPRGRGPRSRSPSPHRVGRRRARPSPFARGAPDRRAVR